MALHRSMPLPGSARPLGTVRPIDLVHLAHQTLGDDGLQVEVLRLFNAQVTLYFDRVRAATDSHEIAMGLHTLKGASQGVGAFALAEAVQAAEAEFRSKGSLDPETLDDIAIAVAEVGTYIGQLVARADAAE